MTYNISTTWIVILVTLALWDLIWRGFALWKAGRNKRLGWFIALLVINSAGVLPIIYLLINRQAANKEKGNNHD